MEVRSVTLLIGITVAMAIASFSRLSPPCAIPHNGNLFPGCF